MLSSSDRDRLVSLRGTKPPRVVIADNNLRTRTGIRAVLEHGRLDRLRLRDRIDQPVGGDHTVDEPNVSALGASTKSRVRSSARRSGARLIAKPKATATSGSRKRPMLRPVSRLNTNKVPARAQLTKLDQLACPLAGARRTSTTAITLSSGYTRITSSVQQGDRHASVVAPKLLLLQSNDRQAACARGHPPVSDPRWGQPHRSKGVRGWTARLRTEVRGRGRRLEPDCLPDVGRRRSPGGQRAEIEQPLNDSHRSLRTRPADDVRCRALGRQRDAGQVTANRGS
jgi:hypothetical protein